MGDAVLLPAATGEAEARVALLQALWSEQPCDGQRRILCRCRLFYRPRVCHSRPICDPMVRCKPCWLRLCLRYTCPVVRANL